MLKTKVERRLHELKKRSVKPLALCISTTAFDQVLSSTSLASTKTSFLVFVVVKPHALDHLWMAFSHTAFHQSFFIFLFIFWMHFAGLMLMIFTCWPADFFRHASFVIKIYLPFIIIFIRITTNM